MHGFWATVLRRPFVKRFAPCYQTVVCPVCLSVTLVYCGQTVGWIKMKRGKQVGLGPCHIVLDGDPAPSPQRGTAPPPPIFGPCLLWPYGWMDQDGTWHGGEPWSRPHCARWVPAALPKKEAEPPQFRPIFIVAKRLDASRCHLVWR